VRWSLQRPRGREHADWPSRFGLVGVVSETFDQLIPDQPRRLLSPYRSRPRSREDRPDFHSPLALITTSRAVVSARTV